MHVHSPAPRRRAAARASSSGASCRGLTLIEVLISAVLLLVAAGAAVTHVVRGAQHAEWTKETIWAHQKAVSILNELRGYVDGGQAETVSDLDPFDDGATPNPTLTITRHAQDANRYVLPDHPASGNARDGGGWRWSRQIQVRPFSAESSRDIRYVTVRIFRHRAGGAGPGTLMAQVSGVISSTARADPSTQAYDLYVIAIENCPGWWVPPDGIRPFVDGALMDLETRLPGMQFRVHWITRLGYGRDEEYAPYANEERVTTDATPWTYVYPGRLPGEEDDERYYDAGRFGARMNLDGVGDAVFVNDLQMPEAFSDLDEDGRWDLDEPFVDQNGNDYRDEGNVAPYALADMHNHAMRWPDEKRRFDERVAAGLEEGGELTWRLLLDQMVLEPNRFRNALFLNMHGELLPMPPVRNYSDAAKIPDRRPGWRAVTHPERLRPRRVPDDDHLSDTPRFRVYAYKTAFPDPAPLTTQQEPWLDLDRNGQYDVGEPFQDWNGNGVRDDEIPITFVLQGMNLSRAPNGGKLASLRIACLAGGVDADGDGTAEAYRDWDEAPVLPETFSDLNDNGIQEIAEPWLDLDGDKEKDAFEPHLELDGNGFFTADSEPIEDVNGNGHADPARPAEPFTDQNGNGRWDGAEPYWDVNGDGAWTPPTIPKLPWKAWKGSDYGRQDKLDRYLKNYGEPLLDLDGNGQWSAAEPFFDADQDGAWDAGFARGEMWCEVSYDAGRGATVVLLHGTPLETPPEAATGRGLDPDARLYDLDYVPSPMPANSEGTGNGNGNQKAENDGAFEVDLFEAGSGPKNTARWTIEIPLDALRQALESRPGAWDGDEQDRLLSVETRFGTDLDTGSMWPVRREPQNVSRTYAWFHASVDTVPFSERFQFLGDPRHCPYADLAVDGTTSPHGYNWFFGEIKTNASDWPGLDPKRIEKLWRDRSANDVGRYMQWLRTALVDSESVWTSMTGFSFAYLSVGGDVGYDKENALKAIPMSGLPFGMDKDVEENTFIDEGTGEIKGSRKLVRANTGTDKGLREGGMWWSKPWLGELFPDEAYLTQWKPHGNLVAATGTTPGTYRLVRREKVPEDQWPEGTKLKDARDELAREGCVSFFMAGTKKETFHHKEGGQDGKVYDEGFDLGQNYGIPLPTQVRVKHPFKVDWDKDGDEPPEFYYEAEYPHYTAELGAGFYAKDPDRTKEQGSAVVRLTRPDGQRAARIVVTGLDPTTEGGPVFTARYGLLSVLHAFLSEGAPGRPNRIRQLPLVKILTPTAAAGIRNPTSVTIRWHVSWSRWDGLPYTALYPETFGEGQEELRYRILYSPDNGATWKNVLDDALATPGDAPLVDGSFDFDATLPDRDPHGDESFSWSTPANRFPHGTYLVRVEAWWPERQRQHGWHMERLYVDR